MENCIPYGGSLEELWEAENGVLQQETCNLRNMLLASLQTQRPFKKEMKKNVL